MIIGMIKESWGSSLILEGFFAQRIRGRRILNLSPTFPKPAYDKWENDDKVGEL